jgi:hypothetical protein
VYILPKEEKEGSRSCDRRHEIYWSEVACGVWRKLGKNTIVRGEHGPCKEHDADDFFYQQTEFVTQGGKHNF